MMVEVLLLLSMLVLELVLFVQTHMLQMPLALLVLAVLLVTFGKRDAITRA